MNHFPILRKIFLNVLIFIREYRQNNATHMLQYLKNFPWFHLFTTFFISLLLHTNTHAYLPFPNTPVINYKKVLRFFAITAVEILYHQFILYHHSLLLPQILFRLEIRLNAFRWSTIPQKKFIIITFFISSLFLLFNKTYLSKHTEAFERHIQPYKMIKSLCEKVVLF